VDSGEKVDNASKYMVAFTQKIVQNEDKTLSSHTGMQPGVSISQFLF
jgi:hypothetical protein